MATIFCTNRLRQSGKIFVNYLKNPENMEMKIKLFIHMKMLGMFVLGGIISTILCHLFLGKAILFTLILLFIILIHLTKSDIKNN